MEKTTLKRLIQGIWLTITIHLSTATLLGLIVQIIVRWKFSVGNMYDLFEGSSASFLVPVAIVAWLSPGLIVGIRQDSGVLINALSVLIGLTFVQVLGFMFQARLNTSIINWRLETGKAEIAVVRIAIVSILSIAIVSVVTLVNRKVSDQNYRDKHKKQLSAPLIPTGFMGLAVLFLNISVGVVTSGIVGVFFPNNVIAVHIASFCNITSLFLMGAISGYISKSLKQINILALFLFVFHSIKTLAYGMILSMSNLSLSEILIPTMPGGASIVMNNGIIMLIILAISSIFNQIFSFLSSGYSIHFICEFMEGISTNNKRVENS